MQNVTTAITSGGQGLTVDEARQHLASGCPLVVPKQDWEQHKEWHGKLRIIQALQCSPVGREEAEQWDYATLLASWLTYEGPLPPMPVASPERRRRREKQQAKKHQQQGGAAESGDSGDAQRVQRLKRVGELACCMHELSLAHGLAAWQNEQYNTCFSEQNKLMSELKHAA
jgi:hypothetical protein